jgi:hypothetical protein
MSSGIHNMFGYQPTYDEKLLGKAKICTVEKLPVDFKVVILYIQKKKVETKILKITKIKKIEPIIISPVKVIKPITIIDSVWRNRFCTFPQRSYISPSKYTNRFSYITPTILQKGKVLTPKKESIINPRPNLIDLCLIESNEKSESKQAENKEEKEIEEVEEIKTIESITTSNIFCLGIDSTYGTLTDFGGKVKRNEDSVSGSLRELNEESYGIFKLKKEDVKDSVIIYNNEISILFVKIDLEIDAFEANFNSLYKSRIAENKKCEISKLQFMFETELQGTLSVPYVIFEPIRELLNEKYDEVINMIKSKEK